MMPPPILHQIIDETAASQEPIMIWEKRSCVTQETFYLLAMPGMRESIKASMVEPLAKGVKALKW